LAELRPMQGIVDWVAQNWQHVKEARTEFDAGCATALHRYGGRCVLGLQTAV
jgi:hypothetical protein